MDINNIGQVVVLNVSHMFNNSRQGQYTIFVSHQVFKNRIFFIRQSLCLSCPLNLVSDRVQFQVSDLQTNRRFATSSAEKGADPFFPGFAGVGRWISRQGRAT